jgi:bifunctional UDP-N-acetylglucosamine pyrophosphorylase/glucosamine-1-phosphate N-acetyltransferase
LEPDFFSYYEKLKKHHEADNIDALNLYLQDKTSSLVKLTQDVPALKYPWELFGILDILFRSENFQPGIHETAKIGQHVVMKGDVRIGANTVIKENTVIEGPCFIGEHCEIGYSNVLRSPFNIEKNVKTGAFFQIKHSIVQEGTHSQSGFIGDSIVGRNCRFGAGFITANRRFDRQNIGVKVHEKKVDTGASYFGVVVGEGTHFGIHSGTMPGVLVGKKCVVYPGAHVFENMPDNSLLKASA